MTGGYATAGYAGSLGFYSTPYYYPGYYGAFGNPAAYYVPYSYGYSPYAGYGYNYWNPAYYARYPASYPYGYQGFYGSYGYPPGYGSSVASFTQSDEEIRDDIRNRLDQNDQLKGEDIDVDVDNGIVTLTGEVKTEQEKDLAETVAFTVAAVRGVHNQLTVVKQPAEKEQPNRHASRTRQRRKSQTED
jgi:hypothetical protein